MQEAAILVSQATHWQLRIYLFIFTVLIYIYCSSSQTDRRYNPRLDQLNSHRLLTSQHQPSEMFVIQTVLLS